MKSFGLHLLTLALLVMLVSCGKDNESGKSNSMYYNNPYYGGITNPNSPYSYGGISVNQVMNENPCINSYQGYPGAGGQRIVLPPVQAYVSVAGTYVGVSSYGDVGVLQGNGANSTFTAYLCPRLGAQPVQAGNFKTGSNTRCIFPPLISATVLFSNGLTADFRILEGGSSIGFAQGRFQGFTFCR